ncbi:MAG: CHAT domain-containing protein [Myxococcales bacterium]|nr:CHAT domain-containing protein [Myxococcales bacterium]MCB9714312.1 CHAT domain-containing protein [Myxococcales bacterium]
MTELEPEAGDLAPKPPGLEVLWGGCKELELPPTPDEPTTCVMLVKPVPAARPGLLRLWLPSAVSSPRLTLAGHPLVAEEEEVDSGTSLAVRLPHSGRLVLTGTIAGRATELLVLDVEQRPLVTHRLKQRLDDAVGKPELQQALEQEWREALAGETRLRERLVLTRYLQFVTFDQGRWLDSARLAEEAARMAHTLGLARQECDSAWAAVFNYSQELGLHAEADRVLATSCRYEHRVPDLVMVGTYFRSIVDLNRGNLAGVRRTVEQGIDIARRLRWAKWERIALYPLVQALSGQGRFTWARRLMDRSAELASRVEPASEVEACEGELGELLLRGQIELREARMLGRRPSAARAPFERAVALAADEHRCPAHDNIRGIAAGIQLELAWVELEEGDLDAARQHLDAVALGVLDPEKRRSHHLLHTELALGRGELAAARRWLDQLEALVAKGEGDDAEPPRDRWHRLVLSARLHRAQGHRRRAIETLTLAQEELGRSARAVGRGVDADRYVAMRRDSGELLVRLLLEEGLVEPALCAARMTRILGLLGPTTTETEAPPAAADTPATTAGATADPRDRLERYSWYLPSDIPVDERIAVEAGLDELMSARPATTTVHCEDLPSPAPGEVSLLPFRDAERWVVFAWDGSGSVIAHPLPPGPLPHDAAGLGERLVDPVAPLLADARRLRVVAPPELAELSPASLQWNGAPIGDAMTVVTAVDLPVEPREAPSEASVALVYSDPQRLLLEHYDAIEGRFGRWATQLGTGGMSIAMLHRPSQGHVSLREVLEGSEDTELTVLYGFSSAHPSRYSMLVEPGEHDIDRTTFNLGATGLLRADILAQQGHAPLHVILAHCHSATIDPYGISGAVGLAQSYVQAGSEWAVGTTSELHPTTVVRLVDALLDAYPEDASVESMARVLQRVEHRLVTEGSLDAGKLRLWVR